MRSRLFLRLMLLVALITATPAQAHNLILEAYPFGGAIAGEAFFSDGVLVGEKTVEVLDGSGEVIGEVTTDPNGGFSYSPTQGGDHRFRLDAGAGHVAEVLIPATAIAPLVGEAAPAEADAPDEAAPAPSAGIEAAVQREMDALRAQIDDYRDRNDLLNLAAAGGILAGIIGLVMFLTASRIVSTLPEMRQAARGVQGQLRAAE